MAGYTLTNFDQIDNALADRDLPIDARFARKHLDSRELGVSRFRYEPGTRAPFGHSHREQEEAYVVTSGSGRVKLDDEIVDLNQWDVLRVAPEVVRGFEAGPDGLEVLAIGGTRPEDGDGVPVRDWWTD
jgi:quercetin dioxygenase-like cupin family protein